MGNTSSVAVPGSLETLVALLRQLSIESGALRSTVPGAMLKSSPDMLLRVLMILAQLPDSGSTTKAPLTGSSAVPDPRAPKTQRDLFKPPDLFPDKKMFSQMRLF